MIDDETPKTEKELRGMAAEAFAPRRSGGEDGRDVLDDVFQPSQEQRETVRLKIQTLQDFANRAKHELDRSPG